MNDKDSVQVVKRSAICARKRVAMVFSERSTAGQIRKQEEMKTRKEIVGKE